MGKWTYHQFHSYTTKEGEKVSFVTQLYKVGIHGIVNNNPVLQGNYNPGQLVTLEKKLHKQQAKGEITDLVFGAKITVSDETGLLEEISSP